MFQGAEQEPCPQGGGPDVPRSARSPLPEDAEERPQPPDGRSLLGPEQHGSPVSSIHQINCIEFCSCVVDLKETFTQKMKVQSLNVHSVNKRFWSFTAGQCCSIG